MHAGASPHWEAMWAQEGGLQKGTRFDVAGPSQTLGAELRRRPPNACAGLTALVPGCGRAYDALALAEHGYAAVVALDVSPAACEAARAELQSSLSPAAGKVEVRCGDFFSLQGEEFDLIWDCTFLCALSPSVRERWAAQMSSLLSPQGELLTCVFPIGDREGGPPYAMSVPLVRSLLEPVGLQPTAIRDDMPLEEMHRRPADELNSVLKRGTALVTWQVQG